MPNVYLAGPVRGDGGDWRDSIPEIDGVRYMHPGAFIAGPDPELHTDLYCPADRLAVRACDVLLAYLPVRPGGHGTAVEIGMALALGKEVLAVCPTAEARYQWRFVAGCVPHVYDSLDKALAVLRYAAAQVNGSARCSAT